MTQQLAPYFAVQFEDAPLGWLHTYASGTTTPKQTWQDQAGATPHTLPTAGVPASGINLDVKGRPPGGFFIGTGEYTFHLYSVAGTLIKSWDDVGVDTEDPVQREKHVATENQTVFTLTGMSYTPGINSLQVYTNGLLLTSADYTETSTTVVTLAEGAAVDDELVFIAGAAVNSTVVDDAVLVTYNPAGTGAAATNVQAKLRESISVADFGAAGGGSTTETTKVQAAIDHVDSLGGGIVWFPPGTYRVRNLNMRSNVTLQAAFGSVVLKLPDGVDGQVLVNNEQSVPTYKNYFRLEGLIFDGNKALAAGVTASSAVAASTVTFFSAKDCIFRNATGYGLGLQGVPGSSIDATQSYVYLENCHFIDNGDGVGGDTFDGLDIKTCDKTTLEHCTANGNVDKGINIRGLSVTIKGGAAFDNGGSGYEITSNPNDDGQDCVAKVLGCDAFDNGGAGFAVTDGGAATQITRVSLTGITSRANLYGVQLPAACTTVELTVSDAHLFGNTSHGVIVSASPRAAIIRGSVIRGNTGSGVYTDGAKVQIGDCQINLNTRYGVEEGASATRTIVAGATYVQSNTLGEFLFNSNGRHKIGSGVLDYDIGTGDIIASAATITLPQGGDVFYITGTTGITSITASCRQRRVTLQFSGVLTVTDGSNLALAGDFITTSGDTLTLVCDGTTWVETSRSVN